MSTKSRSKHRLAQPLPAVVRADDRGRPLSVDGRSIDAIRESWLVEDRWWTDEPVRRRYWEVVTADGRPVVVVRDLASGGWCTQRAWAKVVCVSVRLMGVCAGFRQPVGMPIPTGSRSCATGTVRPGPRRP